MLDLYVSKDNKVIEYQEYCRLHNTSFALMNFNSISVHIVTRNWIMKFLWTIKIIHVRLIQFYTFMSPYFKSEYFVWKNLAWNCDKLAVGNKNTLVLYQFEFFCDSTVTMAQWGDIEHYWNPSYPMFGEIWSPQIFILDGTITDRKRKKSFIRCRCTHSGLTYKMRDIILPCYWIIVSHQHSPIRIGSCKARKKNKTYRKSQQIFIRTITCLSFL